FYRFHSEACPKNAVERGGRAAALQMAKDSAARFLPGALSDLTRDDVADSAKAIFAFLAPAYHDLAVSRTCSLGHDDNRRRIAPISTRIDRGSDFAVIEWDLRDQNNMRAARDTAVQRNPPRVASHDFEHHDAFVTSGGRMQTIERIHDRGDRGIKTERHRSGFQIVVNCLGNTDAINPRFLKLKRRDHRTITADDDKGIDADLLQDLARISDHFLIDGNPIADSHLCNEMTAIRRADDRAAARHDAGNPPAIEQHVLSGWKQAFEAI